MPRSEGRSEGNNYRGRGFHNEGTAIPGGRSGPLSQVRHIEDRIAPRTSCHSGRTASPAHEDPAIFNAAVERPSHRVHLRVGTNSTRSPPNLYIESAGCAALRPRRRTIRTRSEV